MFAQLNTLSVIYNKPAKLWMGALPVPSYNPQGQTTTAPVVDNLATPIGAEEYKAPEQGQSQLVSLMDAAAPQQQQQQQQSAAAGGIALGVVRVLTPAEFQSKWGALKDRYRVSYPFRRRVLMSVCTFVVGMSKVSPRCLRRQRPWSAHSPRGASRSLRRAPRVPQSNSTHMRRCVTLFNMRAYACADVRYVSCACAGTVRQLPPV